jgi:NADPH-dependent curcumin reductase CurA
MTLHNKQWLLISRTTGEPTPEHFKLVEIEVPDLQDGDVLVRHHYLSLDPYMRGRMTDAKNYATLQPLNEVMIGGTVGEVAASKNPAFAVGDPVVGMGGWQLYQHVAAADLGGLRKVDTNRIPLSAYLGPVGMPGVTAWYGLNKIIEPKAGQTVVVSAASGAVGGTVGQLAKARGARAVGLAGGPDKCRYVTQELGFDSCIDYKQHQDLESLSQALKEACPDGIHGHFENVGGMILDAVLLHANSFARVALCGMISRYGSPIPITQTQHILMNRMRLEAFVVSEHMDVWPDALKELGTLAATGKLKYRETVSQGLESAPEALMGLFKGRNFGKQLVKLV